ncbi:hypothetical protein P8625_13225 [Tenacibaculum tangerinum]|uniref:Transposase DDE domain-containing protein n=1 Tax=Tenacibaculum tangerinum TaxID=3038772 RepID=A0ABY8L0Z8_9FLAO|nr:hypothetical protein [Tenacibaculum tangerinum]WGH75025.1 hypothetical protein P8625_13225 [Tenacibaculum tangerinum]
MIFYIKLLYINYVFNHARQKTYQEKLFTSFQLSAHVPQENFYRRLNWEPVFGTLTQYMGLRKVNVRVIDGANTCMLMAGAAYNIKKLLKFLGKPTKTEAKAVACVFWLKMDYPITKITKVL